MAFSSLVPRLSPRVNENSVLEVTESWAEPGNEARHSVHCEKHLQHKILISKAFYFRSCSKVAVNFCFPKATNKHFTYVYHWTLKPAAVTFHEHLGVRLLCCEKRFNVPHDRNVAGNFPILWLITSRCQSCELLDPPWGKTNLLPWWWISTEDQCLKVSSSCYVSWCL